jgi:hypothetical protein
VWNDYIQKDLLREPGNYWRCILEPANEASLAWQKKVAAVIRSEMDRHPHRRNAQEGDDSKSIRQFRDDAGRELSGSRVAAEACGKGMIDYLIAHDIPTEGFRTGRKMAID